jgi:hypothetical protein
MTWEKFIRIAESYTSLTYDIVGYYNELRSEGSPEVEAMHSALQFFNISY